MGLISGFGIINSVFEIKQARKNGIYLQMYIYIYIWGGGGYYSVQLNRSSE